MKLKKLRQAAELTQTALAEKAQVSKSLICLLESGKRKTARYESLAAIASALGIPLEQLKPIRRRRRAARVAA